jgi:hypothetical protein
MKHYKELLILLAAMVLIFTVANMYIRSKEPKQFDAMLLDSLKAENTKLIEQNNARFQSYQDSIEFELWYQNRSLAEIVEQKINWKNEYTKNTLLVGTSLDSAFNEARIRILSKYRAGRFDPRGEERNLGVGTE